MKLIKGYKTLALFFIVGDTAAMALASFLSYLIIDFLAAGDITFPLRHAGFFILISLMSLAYFRMYKVSWRFTSLRELAMMLAALSVSTVIFISLLFLLSSNLEVLIPFALLVYLQGILFIGAFRISKRLNLEILQNRQKEKRAVIFGAGNAGDQIMRDIIRHQHWNIKILAIFDDAESLHGLSMHGVPVKGDRHKMYQFLRFTEIDELIIAIPSLPKPELKSVIEKVKQVAPALKIKVLPSFHLLSDDPVGVKNIREISIEDILGREPARIDMESLRSGIFGKKILITGAGGSIGREIVRQCINLGAKTVIALDVDETEIFHILKEFDDFEESIQPCVANILDEERMDQLLKNEKPDIIFHAAAYKHVPMMEEFPGEAIKVNVEGTRIVADLACKHDVEKFILISTDKAVNPTNVMGATKRIAEEICISFNERCITKFIAVRFGNVLGSRGSVVPVFIEQIQKGGPITITHPDVKRYFMTIPEAVLLVMRAGQMGIGGEVFILDMGKPVKILDMAKQLIRLHGLVPERDIPIEMIGLRPGEKMFEELLKAEEGVENTEHELIYKAICGKDIDNDQIKIVTAKLLQSVRNSDTSEIRSLLKQLVPTYTHRSKKNGAGAESHSSLHELSKTGETEA